MKRDLNETPRKEFVEMVKKQGKIRASLSHTQTYPDEIHYAGILDWEYDTELFAITWSGRRVVASKTMPAFHIYTDY